MSNIDENQLKQRPTQDEARERLPLFEVIKSSASSIKSALLLISIGTFIIGLVIWIFLRGLEQTAYYVVAFSSVIFLIYLSISLKDV